MTEGVLRVQAASEPARFRLTYGGEDLESIDVADLAPALLGLGDVVDAVNSEVTGGSRAVRLRVRSGFRPGSFIVDLELVASTYQRFVDLFAGNQAQAWDTFLGFLGIGGVTGLIQLFRKSRGRPATRVVEIEQSSRVRVTFVGGVEEEVDKPLWRLFSNPGVRSGFTRLVKPLRSADIESLAIQQEGRAPEVIRKDEVELFSIPAEHEGELITESERVLRVVSLSFKAGNKWKVTEGAATYTVSISDPAFLQRVQSGAERFGANDYLRVRLQTSQWTEGEQLKASFSVVSVLEIIRSSTQESLFGFDQTTVATDEESSLGDEGFSATEAG